MPNNLYHPTTAQVNRTKLRLLIQTEIPPPRHLQHCQEQSNPTRNIALLPEQDIGGQRGRLSRSIESLHGQVDFVLIDTPPDLGFIMTTALISADYFIIPVFPSGYDLKGLETLMGTADKVQKRLNPALHLLGVVMGNVDNNARLDADIRQMLRRKFGEDRVFETSIGRSVKHREAPVYGRTVFEHAPSLPAAQQFTELSREVVKRVEALLATAVPKAAHV